MSFLSVESQFHSLREVVNSSLLFLLSMLENPFLGREKISINQNLLMKIKRQYQNAECGRPGHSDVGQSAGWNRDFQAGWFGHVAAQEDGRTPNAFFATRSKVQIVAGLVGMTLCLAGLTTSYASLSAYEPFNYTSSIPDGTASTGSGFTGNWTCGTSPSIVAGMTYTDLPVANGALSSTSGRQA